MTTPARPLHVVVWGASGFTGRLVCEHLVRDYKGVKWAMAGRSQKKMEQVRLDLSKEYNVDLKDIPILTADLSDQASLDKVAGQAAVVLSTAGPFARIGEPVMDAAVRMGSHYVDITGETPWVKQMIDKHHEQAKAKGLRIVPCCGYDSVPADLGALLVVDYIREKLGKKTAKVTTVTLDFKGGISGGTIASGLHGVELAAEAKRQGRQYDSRSVYQLLPADAPRGNDAEWWGVGWQPAIKRWMAPFIMQVCNNKVVHRSAFLGRYGDDFHYQEATGVSSWLAGARCSALGWAGWKHLLGSTVLEARRTVLCRTCTCTCTVLCCVVVGWGLAACRGGG